MGLAWFWVALHERKQSLRLMANHFRPLPVATTLDGCSPTIKPRSTKMGLAWFWVALHERKQPLRLMANQFRPRQRGNSELKRPSRLRPYGQTSRRSLYAFFVFLVRACQRCGWGLFRPWLPLVIFLARPYQLLFVENQRMNQEEMFFSTRI